MQRWTAGVALVPSGGEASTNARDTPRTNSQARFFNAADPEAGKKLIDENTKCIYIETISNPSATVPDFERYVKIAGEAAIPIVCDNTFGQGGWTCKPLACGANLVVESATKWIGGHGTYLPAERSISRPSVLRFLLRA